MDRKFTALVSSGGYQYRNENEVKSEETKELISSDILINKLKEHKSPISQSSHNQNAK